MKNEFKVGDKVSFTITTVNGQNMGMQSKNGTIDSIKEKVTVVKYRNGRKVRVHISNLRKADQRSALTEQVLNMNKL